MTETAYARARFASRATVHLFPTKQGDPAPLADRIAHKNHSRNRDVRGTQSSPRTSRKCSYVNFRPSDPMGQIAPLTQAKNSRKQGLSFDPSTNTNGSIGARDGADAPRHGRAPDRVLRGRTRFVATAPPRGRNRTSRHRTDGARSTRIDLRVHLATCALAARAWARAMSALRLVDSASIGGSLSTLQRSAGGAR